MFSSDLRLNADFSLKEVVLGLAFVMALISSGCDGRDDSNIQPVEVSAKQDVRLSR